LLNDMRRPAAERAFVVFAGAQGWGCWECWFSLTGSGSSGRASRTRGAAASAVRGFTRPAKVVPRSKAYRQSTSGASRIISSPLPREGGGHLTGHRPAKFSLLLTGKTLAGYTLGRYVHTLALRGRGIWRWCCEAGGSGHR